MRQVKVALSTTKSEIWAIGNKLSGARLSWGSGADYCKPPISKAISQQEMGQKEALSKTDAFMLHEWPAIGLLVYLIHSDFTP